MFTHDFNVISLEIISYVPDLSNQLCYMSSYLLENMFWNLLYHSTGHTNTSLRLCQAHKI